MWPDQPLPLSTNHFTISIAKIAPTFVTMLADYNNFPAYSCKHINTTHGCISYDDDHL